MGILVDTAFLSEQEKFHSDDDMFRGANSFFRRRYSRNLSRADIAIAGVPYDLSVSSRSGCRLGPRGVRIASSNLSWEKNNFPWDWDIFSEMAIVDYGDFYFDYANQAGAVSAIKSAAQEIVSSDTGLLSIGGDHSISYPLLAAHYEKHGPLSLVQFDAHSDTWADDDEGRVDHGTHFYKSVKDGLIDTASSIQLGIRTRIDDDLGIKIVYAPELHEMSIKEISRMILRHVGSNKVYLSFDIDGLDPCCAPGTGTPVVGGLFTHQALGILRGLCGMNLVGMDVVEVAPAYDHSEITSLAAANVALDILYLYHSYRRPQRR